MRTLLLLSLALLHLRSYAQTPELIIPIGHTNAVSAAAFSPSGRYLVTGSADHSLLLWDVTSGKLLHRFEGHTETITALAYSPNGRYLLSGSRDNTVRLWDVTSGRTLHVDSTGNSITALRFSSDTTVAFAINASAEVRRYALPGGALFAKIDVLSSLNTIYHAQFSADEQYTVVCKVHDTTNAVYRQHLWHRQPDQVFTGLPARPVKTALSADGQLIAAASEKTILVWNTQTGNVQKRVDLPDATISTILFTNDGQHLLYLSYDDTYAVQLTICPLKNDQRKQVKLAVGLVTTATSSPDGNGLLVGYLNGQACFYDWQSGQLIRTFSGRVFTVLENRFVDAHQTLSKGFQPNARLDSWRNEQQGSRRVPVQKAPGTAFFVGSRHRYVVTTADAIEVRDVATSRVYAALPKPASVGTIEACQLSADANWLLTASSSAAPTVVTIQGWDVQRRRLMWATAAHRGDLNGIQLSPDGTRALSYGEDSTVVIWDVRTGRKKQQLRFATPYVRTACFSPDSRLVAVGTWEPDVSLWDVGTGKLRCRLDSLLPFVGSVVFSPDGKDVLASDLAGSLYRWHVASSTLRVKTRLHRHWPRTLSFSPDGRFLLTSSRDQTAKLVNPITGSEIATLLAVDSTDWVVTTPNGLFDASPGAMKLMHYVVNDSTDRDEPWKVVDLEQLKQRYYQPGLLPILLGHSKEPLRQVPTFENVTLPPTVRLSLVGDRLTVSLNDNKGGIGRVALFINGAEVARDLRTGTGSAQSITIPLSRFAERFDTLNMIRVEAYNGEGWLHSRPETIPYRPPLSPRGGKTGEAAVSSPQRDTRLWAMAVGTSNVGLRFAHHDAIQLANSLRLTATALLGPGSVSVTALTTPPTGPAQTSKADLIDALRAAAQVIRPQDVFVLYMAGHGVNYGGQDGDFYYLTAGATAADATYLNDPAIRQQVALSSQELTALLNDIRAGKKVLILDVCAAGKGADRVLLAARDVPGSQIRALDNLQHNTGLYVLAGSAANAVSYESTMYGQGLLTYALLKGMKGAALRRDGADQFVDVEKLLGYAVREVPQLANGIGGIQEPFYRGGAALGEASRSFDIGRVTEAIRQQIHIAEPKPVLLVKGYQDEATFDDQLQVKASLEACLADLSARGTESPIAFMQDVDYPMAYTQAGRYRTAGPQVRITTNLLRSGKVVTQFTLTGQRTQLAQLARQIIAVAQTKITR